jgi:hypothetical protein
MLLDAGSSKRWKARMDETSQLVIFTLIVILIVVVIAWAVIHQRRSRPKCPRCGAYWQRNAIGCLNCKYSPYLPPDYVPIDDGRSIDNQPITYTQFEGDKSAPWIRRNF